MQKKFVNNFIHRFALISHHRIKLFLLVFIGFWSSFGVLMNYQDSDLEKSSYDQLIRNRIITPVPDPKIIIVDIDEKSLDVLKDEFGRWPWPRETLGGMLNWIEKQGAQVVVFDILFADVDQLNKTSDIAFSKAVEESRTSFFPILRLNKLNDLISEVRVSELKGFASNPDKSVNNPTIAVIPPVFKSILDTTRIGYHNIYSDSDGVNRSYVLWEKKEDWILNSLPLRIGQEKGWLIPKSQKVLINFDREPYSHKSIPFYNLWEVSQSKKGLLPYEELKDAIVIIGSTATNLFDVKSTPVSTIHPGVHVLANIIDNFKNNQFIYELPQSIKLILLWIALLFMGLASERLPERMMKLSIFIIPSIFLGISYLSLNLGHIFIDLTLSASQALLFFSLISFYTGWRSRYWSRFTPRFFITRDTNAYQCSFVLKLNMGARNQQEVISNICQLSRYSTIRQLGWLNELGKFQPDIYVSTVYLQDKSKIDNLLLNIKELFNVDINKLYISPLRRISNYQKTLYSEKTTIDIPNPNLNVSDKEDIELEIFYEAYRAWKNTN
jgi:CHASE2 domain-containing sensor protein